MSDCQISGALNCPAVSCLSGARTVLHGGLFAIQDNLPPRKFRRGQQDNSYGYFYAADNSPLNILPHEVHRGYFATAGNSKCPRWRIVLWCPLRRRVRRGEWFITVLLLWNFHSQISYAKLSAEIDIPASNFCSSPDCLSQWTVDPKHSPQVCKTLVLGT